MRTSLKHKALNLLLLIPGPLLVFLGTLIYERHNRIGLAVEHLGIGLFAVMVLKVTVEAATQREFLSVLSTGVKSQVSDTIVSLITRSTWILNDPVLKDQLKNSVLLPDFVRPFYHLTLRLELLDESKDLLKAFITLNYQVKNVSDRPERYEIGAWLDDVIKLGDAETGWKPGFTKVEIGSVSQNVANLVKRGMTSSAGKDGAIYRKEHTIHLKDLYTGVMKRDETVEITIEGMQIMRTEDHFVWNLPTITEKLTISIELTGGLTFDKLEVYPREMHHIRHADFLKNPNKTANTWKLSIDQVVLPFQGIELRWAPKAVSSAISSTPTPPTTDA